MLNLVVGRTHRMETVPYKRKSRNDSENIFPCKISRNVISLEIFRKKDFLSKTVFFFRNLSKNDYFLSKSIVLSQSLENLFFWKIFISTRNLSKYVFSRNISKSFFLSRSVFSSRIISIFYLSDLYPFIMYGFHKGRYSSA